jgi:hypothetical protein
MAYLLSSRRLVSFLFSSGACLTLGCSSDDDFETPKDVSGEYSLSFSNGPNGCMFEDYEVGATAQGIGLSIRQNGADITGEFQGLVGAYLELVFGSRIMSGDVKGDILKMNVSSRSVTEGECISSVSATFEATSDGDLLEGEMVYTVITNGDASCTAIEDCETIQNFNGTRPPQ